MTPQPEPTASPEKQRPDGQQRPKFITFRMRCKRSITVLDTPQARANAKRMGWVEISTK